jgi:hypothetical protein
MIARLRTWFTYAFKDEEVHMEKTRIIAIAVLIVGGRFGAARGAGAAAGNQAHRSSRVRAAFLPYTSDTRRKK